MEIALVNYDTASGESRLIIRKTLQPERLVELIIGEKHVMVNIQELKAAIEAVGTR